MIERKFTGCYDVLYKINPTALELLTQVKNYNFSLPYYRDCVAVIAIALLNPAPSVMYKNLWPIVLFCIKM